MLKSRYLFILLLLIITCKKKEVAPILEITADTSVSDSLTVILDSLATNGPIVGFSAAIISNDTIVYNTSFGQADALNDVVYTNETIQNIGSISKTCIGIALLKAQEQGHLYLDDPINNYLPFKVTHPNYENIPITIRQLATHTSSINDTDWYGKSYVMDTTQHPPSTKVLDYFSGPKSKMPMSDYLKKVLTPSGNWYEPEIFGTYAPGEQFEYSNIGATLAALVLESAVGTSFDTFTTEHIFKPLEMHATGWSTQAIKSSKRSKVYAHRDTLIADYSLITYPDGGLITSTEDLSLYLSELMNGFQGHGTLLSKSSYQELYKKQLKASQLPEDSQSNSGIFIDYGNYGIGHNGGDPGILTFMYFNEDATIGKILFINTDYDSNHEVLKTFISIWNTLDEYAKKL